MLDVEEEIEEDENDMEYENYDEVELEEIRHLRGTRRLSYDNEEEVML